MRINKYLASAGITSRRKAEQLILNNEIKVNGVVVNDLATVVGSDDIVEYNGKQVQIANEQVYIMLNKPKCYITTVSDDKDRRTVMDLIKDNKHRLFPVGRLDFNTEGLLLITNDGEFANKVMHPSGNISKTYEVVTKVKLTQSELKKLRTGIMIDGVKTAPAVVIPSVKIDEDRFLTTVTIVEGRNRIIRNMFKELHLKVYNLKRIKIGELALDDLKMGSYKYLTKKDLSKIGIID